jgi:hypothetical protein
MITAEDQLADFLKQASDFEQAVPDGADLFKAMRITGDDASELMDSFFAAFEIDASEYRWYFHHAEEGMNFGGLVFKSPDQCVDYIPLTPKILKDAIESKRWPISYPEHALSKLRGDLLINQVLLLVVAAGLLMLLWTRFVT